MCTHPWLMVWRSGDTVNSDNVQTRSCEVLDMALLVSGTTRGPNFEERILNFRVHQGARCHRTVEDHKAMALNT